MTRRAAQVTIAASVGFSVVAASGVAQAYHALAAGIAHGEPPPDGAVEQRRRLASELAPAAFEGSADSALPTFDAWGWLHVLVDDLSRAESALRPAPSASAGSPASVEPR